MDIREITDCLGYGVSPDGQVWSRWTCGRAAKPTGPWVKRKTWLRDDDYVEVSLKINHQTKAFKVHQLVASAFIGPKPDGCVVNHIDLNKQNNNSSNLEYVTHGQNVKHAYDNSPTRARILGERSGRTPLVEAQVEEILKRCAMSWGSHAQIAKDFGVSRSCVRLIHYGKRWPHVYARIREPRTDGGPG